MNLDNVEFILQVVMHEEGEMLPAENVYIVSLVPLACDLYSMHEIDGNWCGITSENRRIGGPPPSSGAHAWHSGWDQMANSVNHHRMPRNSYFFRRILLTVTRLHRRTVVGNNTRRPLVDAEDNCEDEVRNSSLGAAVVARQW